jgi:hypothetical protein
MALVSASLVRMTVARMQTARAELRSARERLAVPSASTTAAGSLSRRMGESAKTKGVRVGSRSAVGAGLYGHIAGHCGSSSSGGHPCGGDSGLLGLGDRRQHRARAFPMPTVRLELLRRATNQGAMVLGVRQLPHRDRDAEVLSHGRRTLGPVRPRGPDEFFENSEGGISSRRAPSLASSPATEGTRLQPLVASLRVRGGLSRDRDDRAGKARRQAVRPRAACHGARRARLPRVGHVRDGDTRRLSGPHFR